MAHFVTRVELHAANGEDYARLHGYMTEAKFQLTIPSGDGVRWRLPTATYYFESNTLDASGVLDLAKAAAAKTKKSFWAITTMGQAAWATAKA